MKAYRDHCTIKVSIKITLMVFIDTVFHKVTAAVVYAHKHNKVEKHASKFN